MPGYVDYIAEVAGVPRPLCRDIHSLCVPGFVPHRYLTRLGTSPTLFGHGLRSKHGWHIVILHGFFSVYVAPLAGFVMVGHQGVGPR